MHTPEIFKLPLSVPFWIVFFFVFVRESRVTSQAFSQASSAQDAGTFRMLMIGSPLVMGVGIAASFLPKFAVPYPTVAVAVGIAMLLAGGMLRRYCFNALGKSFTGAVTVRPDQQIIQHGLYRLVRHPSYTAALLMFTGLGVALGNWISIVVLFVAHCVLYGIRVSVEERALLKTLGQPYSEYMSRTKRFIPFVI